MSLPSTSRSGSWSWRWGEREVDVAYERLGSGSQILMLPAFSTVSTRQELKPLAERLADAFTCTLVDWPGFGDSSRARHLAKPEMYRSFVAWLVDLVAPDSVVVAGHGGGYVLDVTTPSRDLVPRLVLLSPTWRGPLPTVLGEHPRVYAGIRGVAAVPVIGSALYWLNTTKPFIAMMSRRHVYHDPGFIDSRFLEGRQDVARKARGRFASTAFVTGGLDPAASGEEFRARLTSVAAPVLIVRGSASPKKSSAEMEEMCQVERVDCVEVPGALGCYEEHPDEVAQAIGAFLI